MRAFKFRVLTGFLPLTAVILLSCGTAHHFVPYRPLEKGEKQITMTWHYDLNGMDLPSILPDINYYVGLGDNRNFGVGYNPPFYFSHLTFVKYDFLSEEKKWAYYLHLNQLLSSHRNPYFEIGAMHISRTDNSYHQMSFGLAYGRSCNCGSLIPLVQRESDYTKYSRIMPVLKYSFTGRDLGVSMSYYYGFNKSSMAPYADTVNSKNDTILTIVTSQIDSIRHVNKGLFEDEVWTIYLNNDTSQIEIGRSISRYSHWGCVIFIPFYRDFDSPMEKETSSGYVRVEDKPRFLHRFIRINMGEFLRSLKTQDTVYVTAYTGRDYNDWLNSNGLVKDLSVGIGITAYPKED